MSPATASKPDLAAERLLRIESAIAELASEIHQVSTPAQLAARGKPALASIVEAFRGGALGTGIEIHAYVRERNARRAADEARRRRIESASAPREGWSRAEREYWEGHQARKRRITAGHEVMA